MVFAISSLSFAGSWGKDSNGWYYLNDDGTYATSGWQWIDGNNDGTAECYCFDAEGYLYTNTMIDDAKVDSNGAWIQDGVVKTKNTPKSDNSILHQSINSNSSSNNNSITGRLQPGTYYLKSGYCDWSIAYDSNHIERGRTNLDENKYEYIILSGNENKLNFEFYDATVYNGYVTSHPLKMKGTFTRKSDGTYSISNTYGNAYDRNASYYGDPEFNIDSISNITGDSFVIHNHWEGDGGYDTYWTMVKE
ncbi:hypothetical protein [Oribacterium sp. WCC10]|uniref:hypothetical protein n=1 Tax=Oribacterium sp. WCC10 TaxID=1855343 RepID=UPI001587603B|nr:hypothetical protein [Oribacterium sp. WCC10]